MRIGIVGAGAWGTALAHVAADNGHDVILWARESAVVHEINSSGTNNAFLPGTHLDHHVKATHDGSDLQGSDIIINATPTQFVRATYGSLSDVESVLSGSIVVNVAKGIEIGTHERVSEIFRDLAPSMKHYCVLSGPSHAEEVIKDMPTTVVCACEDMRAAQIVQTALTTEAFRIYTTTDVIGVEICGALKNVIAIAAGIIDGAELGDNTKAALMTRGLTEMARLGEALGADKETFFGLAGMGDLIVTAGSRHSRNRFVGEEVGRGRSIEEIMGSMTAIAEGVPTTKAALELAAEVHVELPITAKIAAILFDGEDPHTAIRELMLRPVKPE
jgi:glycerol-3-phosphate dehydrogenase (NAD(P)+)